MNDSDPRSARESEHPYRTPAKNPRRALSRAEELADEFTLVLALVVAFVSAAARVVVAVAQHERFGFEPTLAALVAGIAGIAIPPAVMHMRKQRRGGTDLRE